MIRRDFLALTAGSLFGTSLLSRCSSPPTTRLVEVQDGNRFFEAEGIEGCFAVRTLGDDSLSVVNPDLLHTRFLPASTFKIPNTLIALDSGIIPDHTFSLEWDGQNREISAWNQSHDVTSAMRYSVVWFYQELARRIGPAGYTEYLKRLDYGNRDFSGGIDQFWLDGGLRISTFEQIGFLQRLVLGQLDLKPRSISEFMQVMPRTESNGFAVYGKTGLTSQPPHKVGWFVGWAGGQKPEYVFATLCLGPVEENWEVSRVNPARKTVTEQILKDLSLLPENFPPFD